MPFAIVTGSGLSEARTFFRPARMHQARVFRPGVPLVPRYGSPRFYGLGETPEEARKTLEVNQTQRLAAWKQEYETWRALDSKFKDQLAAKYVSPFSNYRDVNGVKTMTVTLPDGKSHNLQDASGSGWMLDWEWRNWSNRKQSSPKDAASKVGLYNQHAQSVIDAANSWWNEQKKKREQEENAFKKQREIEQGLLDQKQRSLREQFGLEIKALEEQAKAMGTLEKAIQEAIAAGQINPDEAEKIRAQGLEKFLAEKQAETAARIEERKPVIAKAEQMLKDAVEALGRLPVMPDVRYTVQSPNLRRIVKFEGANEVQAWELVSKDGSPFFTQPYLDRYLAALRAKKAAITSAAGAEANKEIDRVGEEGGEIRRNIENEAAIADVKFKQTVAPQRKALETKINNLTWALQILKLQRDLTDAESKKLEEQLALSLTPVPQPPAVQILIRRDSDVFGGGFLVADTPAGRFQFLNGEGDGAERPLGNWMVERPDYHNWHKLYVDKNYKEAGKYKVYALTRADAILAGKSLEEADRLGTEAFNGRQKANEEEDKKKGIQAASAKVSDLWENNKGTILIALGALAILIPVVGLVLSPILSGVGQHLTEEEKKKLAEEVARNKEKELTAIKDRFDKGELTQAQYEDEIAKVAGPEALRILEERRQAALVNRVMESPEAKQIIDEEANKGKTAVVVGGAAAAAAVLAIIAKVLI